MSESAWYERFLDGDIVPDEEVMSRAMGRSSTKLWGELRAFLEANFSRNYPTTAASTAGATDTEGRRRRSVSCFQKEALSPYWSRLGRRR